MASHKFLGAIRFALAATVIVGFGSCSRLPPQQAAASAPIASLESDAPTSSDSSSPVSIDPIAREIHKALLDTAARLDNLKIAFVERGDNVVREPGAPVPVVYKEFWMHGQSAQTRMDWRENAGSDQWWEGFSIHDQPLTSADLETLPGLKLCVDMRRKLAWADSRLLPPGRFTSDGSVSKTLHSVSKSPQWPVGLFLPLLTLGKPWSGQAMESWSPIVNTVAQRPLSAWRLVGEERLDDIDCVKVQIAQQDPVDGPLKRHAGNLTLKPHWVGWFSKAHGLMPVRIVQTMGYGFDGREYELVRKTDDRAPMVYEASDFRNVAGVWMPFAGRQETYSLERDADAPGEFDPDKLVDKLLAEGALLWEGKLTLRTGHEWRVLNMEPIDPAAELWFEPQNGADVHNMDTNERFVQGDAAASKKFADEYQAIKALVGKPAPAFPTGATWLNGEPLTWESLRGKVVILDFWAITCGACYNDVPKMVQLHQGRASSGVIVIGVHSAETDVNAIQEVLARHDIRYPMCIDVPPPEGSSTWGDFASKFAVGAIPHAVAVDSRGIVIASATNRFDEILATAQKAVQNGTP